MNKKVIEYLQRVSLGIGIIVIIFLIMAIILELVKFFQWN